VLTQCPRRGTSCLWSRHCSPLRSSTRTILPPCNLSPSTPARRRRGELPEALFREECQPFDEGCGGTLTERRARIISSKQIPEPSRCYIYRLVCHYHLGSVFVCVTAYSTGIRIYLSLFLIAHRLFFSLHPSS
jgi:hypothetical protein